MDAYLALIVPWTGSVGAPGQPDQSLPPGYSGNYPSQGLPWQPGHPSQGLPWQPGHVGGGPMPGGRPVDPGYGQGSPLPPHVWWGGGGGPGHAGNRLPWGPGHPDQGLPGFVGGGGGGNYPSQGLPSFPGRPDQGLPGGGGGYPSTGPGFPTNPIVIPPEDLPSEPVGPDKMVIVVWVPELGYKLMVVPKPPGMHTKPNEPAEPKR